MSQDEGKQSARSKGGIARAQALPAKRRKEIGRAGAEVRWARAKTEDGKLLRATHNGVLHIGDVPLNCAVLEDGTRVLSQRTFVRAIGRRGNLQAAREDDGVISKIPAFLAAENLKPFLPTDLGSSSTPILYLGRGGRGITGVNVGYRAELLPVVCQVYQDARDARKLLRSQEAIADACKVLFRGFATVGIVALVDEATGYQEVRDRRALQTILDRFLSEKLAAWAKRFPDEFYDELFRLRGWQWERKGSQRPVQVAKDTINLVYMRMLPDLLKELESRNPKDERGRRRAKHHQFFSPDLGSPALNAHVHAVLTLMKAFDTFDEFKVRIDRSLPVVTRLTDLPLFNQPDETNELAPPVAQLPPAPQRTAS